MNTVEAIYEKGVFRPIEKIELTEGERVKITVEIKIISQKDSAEDFSAIAVDTGISDLATNVDHYLYGLPKQSEE